MKKPIKIISWILSCLILFQSCITTKTILIKAIEKEQENIRVKTHEGTYYKFKKLILRDSTLYGVANVKGQRIEQDISILNIKKVKVSRRV